MSRYSGIERINLNTSGPVTLKIATADLLDLSDTTNKLAVLGDAQDQVKVTDGAWTDLGATTISGQACHHYASGGAQRHVQHRRRCVTFHCLGRGVDPLVSFSPGFRKPPEGNPRRPAWGLSFGSGWAR